MKEMTSAEFAKANLAALEEPVTIRRYTKALGTYYPVGTVYVAPDAPPPPSLFADLPVPGLSAATKRISELEEEVARLKKLLAARPPEYVMPPGRFLDQTSSSAPLPKPDPDRVRSAFADLPKQDREFFERKLGKKK